MDSIETLSIGLLSIAFVVNFLSSFILVRFIYYPKKKNRNYIFTFLALSTILFFVVILFRSIELSLGASFGLFAIFSVLHYRTNTIPAREMTYVFCSIALPIINSGLINLATWPFVLFANLAIIILFFVLEQNWGFNYNYSQTIKCNDTTLVLPENRQRLIEELKQKTGIDIKTIEIQDVDFTKDSFSVKIQYKKV